MCKIVLIDSGAERLFVLGQHRAVLPNVRHIVCGKLLVLHVFYWGPYYVVGCSQHTT